MELVLLEGLFSERDNTFFGLSLILWKGHPLANDFAARLVVFFHVRGSFAYLICDIRKNARSTAACAPISRTYIKLGPVHGLKTLNPSI
jgi:hypothetical protein